MSDRNQARRLTELLQRCSDERLRYYEALTQIIVLDGLGPRSRTFEAALAIAQQTIEPDQPREDT